MFLLEGILSSSCLTAAAKRQKVNGAAFRKDTAAEVIFSRPCHCARVEVNQVLEMKAMRTSACLLAGHRLAKQKQKLPWCAPMESLTNLACVGSLKWGRSSWPSLQHLGSEAADEAGLSEHLPKQRGHKLSLAYRTGGEHPNAAGHGDVYPSHGGCSGWAPSPSDISRIHDDTRILRWCPSLSRDMGTKDSEREQLSLCLEAISHVTFSIWEEEIMLAQGQQIKPHGQHWYHLEKKRH